MQLHGKPYIIKHIFAPLTLETNLENLDMVALIDIY